MGKIYLLTLITIFALIFWFYISFTNRRNSKKALERLRIFKIEAQKIPVQLKSCKIKQTVRYEKIDKSYNQQKIDALDSHFCDIQRDDTKELVSCMVTYKATFNGRSQTFHTYIDKDELTLQFLFARQKTTYIYVDKLDKNNYYFDLEFLDSF